MTRINKLVVNGFKSFGRWTEVPFDNGFNVILGPNGSGKSNILDALCFVLGRISSKSMRAEKLGYLVYNGGKAKQPASKAEVSIFFDNAGKQFPVDAPVLKVSRLVKPDGQSIYRINDERSTRQQIIDTLSAAKIDPDGHNIVLQGDIVHFVEMSPEERRQVVEEIAGISVYEDKKQKALLELDKVEQGMREADILLSEKKVHLKELKQDRDHAIRYRELHDKIRQNRATLLNVQAGRKESEKAEIEKSMGSFGSEAGRLKDEIDSQKRLVSGKKDSILVINREIEEKGEKEQVRLNKEIEELRVDIGTASNRISMCEAELQKIAARRESLKKDHSDVEARISEFTRSRAELEVVRNDKLIDKTRIEASIERIRKDSRVASIGDIEAEIERVEKELDSGMAEYQSLSERKQSLLRDKDRLEVQIQGMDAQISKVGELERESRKELELIRQKREEFKKLVMELNQSLNEDSSFAARIADAKRRLSSAEEELAKVRAKTMVSREANFTVQKVLEQKDSIRGIFGTVADLGKVQSRYATALEVAAGPRVNSIVVQGEDVASECIRFLKSNKLGVATFLPLAKMKPEPEQSSRFAKANGVHGLAIDLVSFDPKFRRVFSYVFGSTLVVESLDVARRIGIGEARMVTIDGDLAEVSGAMHGGFRQKRQLAFQEADMEKDLKERESRVAEIESLISLLERQRSDNESKILSLKQGKADIEGDIIRSERMLSLESSDLDASVKQKELLSGQLMQVDSALLELQESISSKNRMVAEIKMKKQKLRDQISELRNPAVVAELNAFEQKRQQLIEEILIVDSQVRNFELQVNEVLVRDRDNLQRVLKQLDREEEQFSSERAGIRSRVDSSRKLLREAEEKSASFQKKYRELFESKARLSEEVQKAEEKIIRREEQINTIEVRLNSISLKNSDVAAELTALRKELEQYSDVQLMEESSEEKLREHVNRYERSLSEMGNVNLKALEVYDDVERQYSSLLGKKERLVAEKQDVIALMDEIEVRKKELFMNTFSVINDNFIRIFKELSTRGEARLVIEDEEHLFQSGVRIRVNLTGEKFLDIRGLSGGEKSMTALALIFAIQEYSPASFYIFDEVDAALDKRNAEKLSLLIRKYSEKAQYIVISHNDTVLTSASVLYGVSMNEDGISSVVSLKV